MSNAPIREKLSRGQTVILDGAIGTEILRRNVTWADHQLVNKPEFVRGIHEDYMRAGAEIISTNSFQLCRRALYNHFRDDAHRQHIGASDLPTRAEKLLAASVKLALEARDVEALQVGPPAARAGRERAELGVQHRDPAIEALGDSRCFEHRILRDDEGRAVHPEPPRLAVHRRRCQVRRLERRDRPLGPPPALRGRDRAESDTLMRSREAHVCALGEGHAVRRVPYRGHCKYAF